MHGVVHKHFFCDILSPQMLGYIYAQSHGDDGHIVQLMLHVAIISYVLHAVHPMHTNIMQLLVLVDFSKLENKNG